MSGITSDNVGRSSGLVKAAAGGKTVKRHYFEMGTRTAATNTAAATQFTITSSFVPIDPVVNDLWVKWITPVDHQGNNQAGFGLKFNDGSTDYDFPYKGVIHIDAPSDGSMGVFGMLVNISAGVIPAGTYTIYVHLYSANSQPNYWNPSTTDNVRYGGQTFTTLMITEYKN
jgi:hypothetical protein